MPQIKLLPGTVWTNLTATNPEAEVVDVRRVCEALQLIPIIESLPDGFDTELSEAVTYQLPTGALKLLGLAQVVIKDASILLLDDLSQGLTPDQFDAVLQLLPTLCRSAVTRQPRSVIVATDNKRLLESADLLCILDKGVTTFQGTPEELRQRMQRVAQRPVQN
jgi:ABC-type transport system involved in cytochrome bd biosynthesis fused ATPase/permease subunit